MDEELKQVIWVVVGIILVALAGFLSRYFGGEGPIVYLSSISTAIFSLLFRMLYDIRTSLSKRHEEILTRLTAFPEMLRNTIEDLSTSRPEVLTHMGEALERARSMQKRATRHVCGMWTVWSYDDDLKGYYKETLTRPNIYTERIIDLANPRICNDDILDHIQTFWQYLRHGTYSIYVTRGFKYEVAIVDDEDAAIFHYPGQGFSCFYIRHGERKSVAALKEMFNAVKWASVEFPARTGSFGDEFDAERVKSWVEKSAK